MNLGASDSNALNGNAANGPVPIAPLGDELVNIAVLEPAGA
jgi:hypothetical protein